jgi:hypothetical protein
MVACHARHWSAAVRMTRRQSRAVGLSLASIVGWSTNCKSLDALRDKARQANPGAPASARFPKTTHRHIARFRLGPQCSDRFESCFPHRIRVFEPENRPSKKLGNTWVSLTVDGLWSSTVFGERESKKAVLRPKTAFGGLIRPQFSEMPKRPGLRHRRQHERQGDRGVEGPSAPRESSLSGTWWRKTTCHRNCENVDEVKDFDGRAFWTRKPTWDRNQTQHPASSRLRSEATTSVTSSRSAALCNHGTYRSVADCYSSIVE